MPMQEMQFQSLSWEDPLGKELATHFSIIAWETPWTEEPDGLQSTGSQKSQTPVLTKQQQHESEGLSKSYLSGIITSGGDFP